MTGTLLSHGVRKGYRVIPFLPKSIILVVTHFATQRIGAISVPMNPGFRKTEMKYLIKDAGSALILAGREQRHLLGEVDHGLNVLTVDTELPYQDLDVFSSTAGSLPPIAVSADDPGLIIYTSGTTGNPKGAVLTQKNLLHDAMNIHKVWEITESDMLCHALPLFHVHGLCFALHTCLLAGSHVLLLDQFSPSVVMDILSKKKGSYDCTVFMGVPAMYNKMMGQSGNPAEDFLHVRLWTSGSAPLLKKNFETISRSFGKEPVEREGMTETGMNFSNPLKGKKKPGSIGCPLPGLEVRLVDPETFQDVQSGQTGEFWLKGPSITPGYWQKPEETAKAFQDGWFRTGDLGKRDKEGYFYLTDRIKQLIISGGENISPKEVETVIHQLEGVKEVCVVGITDPKWGEKVVAAVVLKSNAELNSERIRAFCKENLLAWKCPKDIIFVEEIPKNTMGKIVKKKVISLFDPA